MAILEMRRKTKSNIAKINEAKEEYKRFLEEIFEEALENRVYFTDKEYMNRGQISINEFQSLFNYNYLNATRILNDEKNRSLFFY